MGNKQVFNKLKAYKESNGLTVPQLCRIFEIPEGYYYRWQKKGMSVAWSRAIEAQLKDLS